MKILTLLFLLSSCAAISDSFMGSFPDANQFFSRFPGNKKAIVIFKFYSEPIINKNYSFCKIASEESSIKTTNFCVNFTTANKNKIMLLEPGIYSLANYDGIKNNQNYIYKIDPKKHITQRQNTAFFMAREGHITYVGALYEKSNHIKFFDEFNKISLNLKNKNFDFLLKNFADKKQDLLWLADIYQKNPQYFVKNIAYVKRIIDEENYQLIEAQLTNLIKNASSAELARLSTVIEFVNNEIEIEKHKMKMETSHE